MKKPLLACASLLLVGQAFALSASIQVNVGLAPCGQPRGNLQGYAIGGVPPYTYSWSNGATTASVNGLAAGTYTVLITDANGCTLLLTFTLDQPTSLAMPTGFSPNGDGANDAYIVQGLDGFASNQLVVFNRWGNVVYHSNNLKESWDGRDQFSGADCPVDVYIYNVKVKNFKGELQEFTGRVTLLN